jgi:hypothetical protein
MNPQKRQFEMMSAVLDRSVKDFGKHLNIEKDVLMDVKDPQRMLFKTLTFKSDRSKCFKFFSDVTFSRRASAPKCNKLFKIISQRHQTMST